LEILLKYFPDLTSTQIDQFGRLQALYVDWNEKINVISRKDVDHLYERHVLHSLAIYKFLPFQPGSKILDIGTGGGFPAIPLAIIQPDVQFIAVDSIGKKIKVVQEVAAALGLKNIVAKHLRAEEEKEKFDFVVSRAVAELRLLLAWSNGKYLKNNQNALPNGLICLKGGDLSLELKAINYGKEIYDLTDYFKEEFFETKKLIYVAV
jgi:16S rRNA (guanine527-N7)-methyltransferase